MNIYQKLIKIQNELKAPKNQYNSFGKYKYRSCEDILEALKPLLKENNLLISLSDDMVNVGNRNYIKATVRIIDSESGEIFENTAFAREDETKKGMDGSQITGASSSYARKYALNGMFAIDDTKDADTDAYTSRTKQAPTKPKQEPKASKVSNDIKEKAFEHVVMQLISDDFEYLESLLNELGVGALKELDKNGVKSVMVSLNNKYKVDTAYMIKQELDKLSK